MHLLISCFDEPNDMKVEFSHVHLFLHLPTGLNALRFMSVIKYSVRTMFVTSETSIGSALISSFFSSFFSCPPGCASFGGFFSEPCAAPSGVDMKMRHENVSSLFQTPTQCA